MIFSHQASILAATSAQSIFCAGMEHISIWLAGALSALISFLGALARSPYRIALDLSWETAVLIRILVQPVSVYLLVVLVRIVKGVANSGLEWKNVFTI